MTGTSQTCESYNLFKKLYKTKQDKNSNLENLRNEQMT